MSPQVLEILQRRRGELEAVRANYANWSKIVDWHSATRPVMAKHFADQLTAFDEFLWVNWTVSPRAMIGGDSVTPDAELRDLSHLCLAARASQGPRPGFGDFGPLLVAAQACAGVRAVAADAGFDSEANHELARDELGVQSLMPAEHGRPGRGEPAGRYRRQMKRHLHESRYGQRWQVETVYSMIKRLSGEVVNARTYWRRCRLLLLKVLTHNITILKRQIGFLLSRTFYISLSRKVECPLFRPHVNRRFLNTRSGAISGRTTYIST